MPDVSNIAVTYPSEPDFVSSPGVELSRISLVQSQGSAPPPVTNAPTVSGFVPAPGTDITPYQPVQFDVTDLDADLQRVVIHAQYADGTYDVVYDGDVFAPSYALNSTVATITDGFRFQVVPVNGWPSAPSIRVLATDASGLETT